MVLTVVIAMYTVLYNYCCCHGVYDYIRVTLEAFHLADMQTTPYSKEPVSNDMIT